MTIVASVDPITRRIYLHSDTVGASVHPIDIYKEVRALRRLDETLRSFDSFMRADGNVSKGGGKFTERFVTLLLGTRIVPYDTSHELTITGTLITDAGTEGIAAFDRSSLSVGTAVDINYVPPQVEIIATGSGVTAQDIVDIKNSIFDEITEGGETYREMLVIMRAVMAGKVSVSGNVNTFRDLADTKNRVVSTTDENGQRLSVTVDGT